MRAFSTVKKNFIYGAPGLGDRVHSVLLSYNYALANDDSVNLHLTKHHWNRNKPVRKYVRFRKIFTFFHHVTIDFSK